MRKPSRNRNGTWTLVVQFERKRRQLTLGKVSKADANQFAKLVHDLVQHVKHGTRTLPAPLQAWIRDLGETHKRQLSDIGLFEYRSCDMTVGELMELYLEDYHERDGISPGTKRNIATTINNRLGKLARVAIREIEPVSRSLRSGAVGIQSREAKKRLSTFNAWQRNHFAPATWTRDNKLFSSVGIWAIEQGILEHNPFSDLPKASMVNEERNQYIEREWVVDAMEAALHPDIRLTLAMGRFAGMRTCSEVRTMKWSHVDTRAGTLTVIDSKNKKPRVMPLLPSIAAELERQRELTGDTRFVASPELRLSTSSANYQRVKEAISRSGQTIWQRLRQNLRASCENDLLEVFEERLVTQWIGHTVAVSRAHYQKLRPSDYRKAVESAAAHQL